jgi:hypothetical protein
MDLNNLFQKLSGPSQAHHANPPVPLMSNLVLPSNPVQQAPEPVTIQDNFRDRHLQDQQNTLMRLQYDFEFV